MKLARYIAIFLTLGFIGIVSIERVPGVLTLTAVPHEWLMFGLFKISLVDDITHALSGIFGIIALIAGARWTVKYLMLIGGYYTLDALFFIVNGFLTGQPVMENISLNFPHIVISVLVFIALRSSVKQIVLNP
jgi:hypothetical protein